MKGHIITFLRVLWDRHYAWKRFSNEIILLLVCWVVEGYHQVLAFWQIKQCCHFFDIEIFEWHNLRLCLCYFDEALRNRIVVGKNFCVLCKGIPPSCWCHVCVLLQCGRRLNLHTPSSCFPSAQCSSLVIIGVLKELLAPCYMCTTQVHLSSH